MAMKEKSSNRLLKHERSNHSIIRDIVVGPDTRIFDQVNLYKCTIGANCKIDAYVYIEEGVVIGDNCKIRAFTFIPTGVTIGDNVFVGPRVTFTNDRYPKAAGDWRLLRTTVNDHASIGAASVILPGVTIGRHSLIGAGSVVTRDVPDFGVVAGVPARLLRYRRDQVVKMSVRSHQSLPTTLRVQSTSAESERTLPHVLSPELPSRVSRPTRGLGKSLPE